MGLKYRLPLLKLIGSRNRNFKQQLLEKSIQKYSIPKIIELAKIEKGENIKLKNLKTIIDTKIANTDISEIKQLLTKYGTENIKLSIPWLEYLFESLTKKM